MEKIVIRMIDGNENLIIIKVRREDNKAKFYGIMGEVSCDIYTYIKPMTEAQKTFVEMWEKYRNANVTNEEWETICDVATAVDTEYREIWEAEQKFDIMDDANDKEIKKYLVNGWGYTPSEANCVIAVMRTIEIPLSEIHHVEIEKFSCNIFKVFGFYVYADTMKNLTKEAKRMLQQNNDAYIDAIRGGYEKSKNTFVREETATDEKVFNVLNRYMKTGRHCVINGKDIVVCC